MFSGGENIPFPPMTLSGSQATLPNNSIAIASANAARVGFTISFTGSFSGLSSPLLTTGNTDSEGNPPSAINLQYGNPSFDGPVVRNLAVEDDDGDGNGTFTGAFTFSTPEQAALIASNYYINIHTQDFPDGELRSQAVVAFKPGTDNAFFSGGAGNDVLTTTAGNDTLVGGQGDDLLVGGAGADLFVLQQGGGVDIVLDFNKGQDLIGLLPSLSFSNLTITQGTNGNVFAPDSQNNTLIKVQQTGEILAALAFTQANAIAASDFITVASVPT